MDRGHESKSVILCVVSRVVSLFSIHQIVHELVHYLMHLVTYFNPGIPSPIDLDSTVSGRGKAASSLNVR